jgi:hypothetical protein
MDTQLITLDEIRSTLDRLRQDSNTKRRFPKTLWDSIIQLTKFHPVQDICHQLNINPIYLRCKIRQSKEHELEFREVALTMPSSLVTIELSSKSGLKATIQGPISCLNYLHKLFGG